MNQELADFLRARHGSDRDWALSVLDCGSPNFHGFARRVLADTEAKQTLTEWGNWPGGGPDSRDAYEYALAVLALPYADHPDYRQEWRP